MLVDALATWPHYASHLDPIWAALPAEVRGTFWAPRAVARDRGLTEGMPGRAETSPVLVAGFSDHHALRPTRPTIMVNHGCGQAYRTTKSPESFSGGPGRERVLLHLEPGPLAARATAAAGYPYAVVGCPLLDRWHACPPTPEPGLVVVALHHNGRGAPEQMSAFTHFEAAFADLVRHVKLVGHGHPRGWERTANRWHSIGVEPEPSFASVLDRASLLVTDISSAGPMFASTGRPVVWVSAPWHTAAPESGGRFHDWTRHVEGAHGHVTDPADLVGTVLHHLFHPSRLVAAQQPIVDDCYAYTDGHAAQRAAEAVCGLL